MKNSILTVFIFLSIPAFGQHTFLKAQNVDTLFVDSIKNKSFLDHISQTHWFNATYLGVPLIIGGLIEKHQDTKFSRLRNDFMPEFHRNLDNYTQFAPAAVMVGLKAAGVKRIRIHDLRHSSCALLINLGYSPVQIAERLGHESVTITERYSHLYPSVQRDMAKKLDSVFKENEDDD